MARIQQRARILLWPVSVLLLPLLFPRISCSKVYRPYADCYPPTLFTCGDHQFNVSYPFTTRGRQDYCGYKGYYLYCENTTTTPTIDINDRPYRVLNISYTSSILTVVDAVFLDQPCPQPFKNTTLDFDLYEYSHLDQNLTLHFNCPSTSPPSSTFEVACLAGVMGPHTYFTLYPAYQYQLLADILGSCLSVSLVPLSPAGVRRLSTTTTSGAGSFVEAVRGGFDLWWKAGASWCGDCLKSGGVCGYDSNSPDAQTCYCSNGLCPKKEGHVNIKRKIAIAVGASAAGFILASVFCFLWYRRKKRKEQSGSSAFLRSTSSELSMKKDLESASTHYQTHLFSYKELEEATNGFDSSKELGDGGFGTVYKGKLRDGRTVAVKRLYENNYRRVEQFMNEIGILNRLHHQNLVTLYGCTSRHSRELLLVYEYVSNGTVADHLHGGRASDGALTWPVRMSIAIETATALAYLHAVEPQIIHRDVKTNNILLDANFIVKVADFGLSRLFPVDVTHVSTAPQGTPGYVDPEYHQCYQLTEKSDVYSFGVVLVELISSKPAVDITRHRQEINLSNMAINKIQNGALHELVDPGLGFESDSEVKRMITLLAELAFRCLQGEKEMRPTMEEVLEVLKGIEDVDYKVEKPEDVTPKDETRLLKNVMLASPDSVTVKWTSRTTTPNTSV